MNTRTKLAIAFALSVVALLGAVFVVIRLLDGPPADVAGRAAVETPEPEAAEPIDRQPSTEAPATPEPVAVESPIPVATPAGGLPGWFVTGRVVVGESSPLAGVTIRLLPHPRHEHDNPPDPRDVVTGGDGRFELAGVPAAMWLRIEIDPPGYAYRTLSFRFDEPTPADGGRKDLGDLPVDPAGAVTVLLRGPTDRPVPGGEVLINKRSGHPTRSDGLRELGINESRQQAVERGEGEYVLERAPVGPLYAEAKAPGHVRSGRVELENPPGGLAEPLVIRLEEGHVIAGVVTDVDGEPVVAARVDAMGPVGDRVESGERGAFRLDTLRAGTYSLSVQASGHVTERVDGVATGTGDVRIVLTPEAVLFGRVVAGEDEKPIAGATVSLQATSGRSSYSDETDAEGRFEVDRVPTGAYTVVVDHPEYATEIFPDPIELASRERRDAGVVRLGPGLTATGLVVDAISGTPIAGAEATLRLGGAGVRLAERTATSDDAGQFELRGLVEGEYAIAAKADGFYSDDEETVSIAAGDDAPITVALNPGSTITGRILDGDGNAIEGATVRVTVGIDWQSWNSLYARFSEVAQLTATSDVEGRYRLDGLIPHPNYAVIAEHARFAPRAVSGLALHAGERLEGVDLRLRAGGQVTGRVTRGDGEPVAGADVMAYAPVLPGSGVSWIRGVPTPTATTDAEGRYALERLDPSTYTVTVRANDAPPASREGIVVEDGQTVERIDIELGEGVVLAGVVVDPEGHPISGASVQLWRNAVNRVQTGEDGSFRVTGLEAGRIRGRISKTGWVSHEIDTTAPSESFTATLQVAGLIRGVLRAEDATTFGNFSIIAQESASGSRHHSSFNGPTGDFELSVAPGTHVLTATVRGYAPARSEPLRVEAGEVAEVVIDLLEGCTIAGVVVDAATGASIEGASVMYLFEGEPAHMAWNRQAAVSRADGTFTLDSAPPGKLVIRAQHQSYSEKSVTDVVGRPGETVDVRLELSAGGRVRGIVTREGAPVAGASLYVGNRTMPGKSATTGADGRFEVAGLSAGEYTVSVQVTVDGRRKSLQETVIVVDGEVSEVEIEDVPGIVLRGRITANGAPVQGGDVMAMHPKTGPSSTRGKIDDRGRYSIEIPAPGDVSIIIRRDSGAGGDRGARVVVTIPRGRREVVHDIDLAAGEISGTVVDAETGDPISRVEVGAFRGDARTGTIWQLFERLVGMSSTDANGRFTLSNLENGTYSVRVFARDRVGAIVENVRVAGRAVVLDPIELERGVNLTARAVDERGRPVVGAIGFVRDAAGTLVSLSQSSPSDATGRLTIQGLPPGTYNLTVTHHTLAAGTASVEAGSGAAIRDVVLPPGGRVSVSVVDGRGRPVEDATIRLVDEGGRNIAGELTVGPRQLSRPDVTDSGGTVRLGPVRAGGYRAEALLAVEGESRVVGAQSVTVVADDTVNVTIVTP